MDLGTEALAIAGREIVILANVTHEVNVAPVVQAMPAEPGPMTPKMVRRAGPLRGAMASANIVASPLLKTAREMSVAIVPTGRRRGEAQTIAVRGANVAPTVQASTAAAAQATILALVLRVVSAAGFRRQSATASANSVESRRLETALEMAVVTEQMGRRPGVARAIVALTIAVPVANVGCLRRAIARANRAASRLRQTAREMAIVTAQMICRRDEVRVTAVREANVGSMVRRATPAAMMREANTPVVSAAALRRHVRAVATVARRRPQRVQPAALAKRGTRRPRTTLVDARDQSPDYPLSA